MQAIIETPGECCSVKECVLALNLMMKAQLSIGHPLDSMQQPCQTTIGQQKQTESALSSAYIRAFLQRGFRFGSYPSSYKVKLKGRQEVNVYGQSPQLASQAPADHATALVEHLHPGDQLQAV